MEKIKLLRTGKKIKPVLSPQDIERILNVFDKKTFTGCRNFTMVYTFYDTMIRLSELCNIELSDLNMIEQNIKVHGKGRKERYVFFGKKLAKYLQLYLYGFRQNIPGEYLFCKSDGNYLPPDQVQHIFRRYSKKVGIHFTPHLLRHSAGTQWIKNHGSPLSLQQLMGHSSFRTTQKYVHLALEDLKKEHVVHSLGDSLNYR
jgi:site-specific recombinase XerD